MTNGPRLVPNEACRWSRAAPSPTRHQSELIDPVYSSGEHLHLDPLGPGDLNHVSGAEGLPGLAELMTEGQHQIDASRQHPLVEALPGALVKASVVFLILRHRLDDETE